MTVASGCHHRLLRIHIGSSLYILFALCAQAHEVRQRHGSARILMFALRRIRRGEELVIDYMPNVSVSV